MTSDDMITVFGMVALVVVVVGFVFYVRWRTVRRLQDLMNANATKDASAQHLIEQGRDNSDGMAATMVQPEITMFDDLGQLESAVQAREAFVGKAVASLRKSLAIDAIIALGYAGLPWLVDLVRQPVKGDGAWLGVAFGALYLVLAALRYMLFRTQFRAIDERSRTERIAMTVVNILLIFVPTNVHVMTLLEWLLAPRAQAVFMAAWIAGMIFLGLSDPLVPGLALAALLHAGLIVWRLIDMQHEAGKRLVVLRVFGVEKNAEFLFDGVLGFWKHFGHFFTIVDPAFWRHSHALWSGGTLWFLGLAMLAAFVGYLLHDGIFGAGAASGPLAAALFALPLLAIYARWAVRHVDQSFIRSKAHLDSLLAPLQARPRHLDMTYKRLETRCYNDTWEMAVAEFTRGCDAVIMDLRGYQPPRLGCTIELNFLLDTVPAERIVFVSDSESDPQAAAQLILDAWKELRATSPNLDNPAPSVRIYLANRRDHRDIQGVIDLLISAASAQAASAAATSAHTTVQQAARPANAF